MDTRLTRRYAPLFAILLQLFLAISSHAVDPAGKARPLDRHGDPLPQLARGRIGTTRFRHGDEIISLTFAPDSHKIATLGWDGMLRLWDAAEGKELASFDAPEGMAVAFTKDGQALLWFDAHGWLYRCDVGQRGHDGDGRRQCVYKFELTSSERMDAAAFAADGSAAVVGTSGNHVYFWGRKGAIQLRDGVQTVALDRSGQRLAVNNGHEGVRLQAWDGQNEVSGTPRFFGTDTVRSLAFSPDGRILAAGDFDNCIHLWDTSTSRETRVLEGHRRVPISGKNGVFCLAFSPDGRYLASGGADGSVRIWDVKSGKELVCCSGHGKRVRALAFSPDGKVLASAGADNAIRLWEPATGRAIGPTAEEGGAVTSMSVSPDGRTLALVRLPGQLSLWDATTGKELPTTPKPPAPVSAATFLPMGQTLASATAAGQLHFWDCVKGKPLPQTRNVSASIRLLASTSDGTTLVGFGNDRRVVFWNATTGQELQRFQPQTNMISQLLFSRDDQTLFIAGSGGVQSLAMGENKIRGEQSLPLGSVLALAESPDGRMLATGGQDGVVRLWELASGKQRRAMQGDTAAVNAVSFSSDGNLLAAGGRNGLLRLWNVASGERLHSLDGHRGAIVAVAFVREDSLLITASADGTALVWDVPALLEVGRSRRLDLSPRQVRALWRDLASDDALRAYEAVETLARASEPTVPFLREHVAAVSEEKMAQRLRNLDSSDYEARVRATHELAEMGKFAEPALRKLLAEKPSLEARRRTEELLALLDRPSVGTEQLRALRAVEVLEKIGTDEARQALQVLAQGMTEATLTREAKSALARLASNRKKATSPDSSP